MILGFLGKGGSGKSTVATQMALWLHSQDKEVLAIDADHNMDLAYNLTKGELPEMNHLGSSREDLFKTLEVNAPTFKDAFKSASNDNKNFYLSKTDPFTKKYSHELQDCMHIMMAGPQTKKVLKGGACSHSLTAPLKVYLPLLKLEPNQAVVVDEKAGADGVSTGVVTGFDMGVIVVEPSLHSTKTARQIAELMEQFDTPYVFVANKIASSDDHDFIERKISQKLEAVFPLSTGIQRDPYSLSEDWIDTLTLITAKGQQQMPSTRQERTQTKFST